MESPNNVRRHAALVVLVFVLSLLFSLQATSASRFFDSTISPLPTPPAAGPLVIRIEPDHSDEGVPQRIVIHGLNFAAGTQPTIDETPLEGVERKNSTWINATVPPTLEPGSFTIKVCNPDGKCSSLQQAYTVMAEAVPVLQGIVPGRGFNDAPNTIVVVGLNFKAGMTLKVGSTPLQDVTRISPTQARGTVPAQLAAGSYDVVACNPGSNVTATLAGAYTVLARDGDDLYVSEEDLWTVPATIHAGDAVTLGVNLHRVAGTAPLENVRVAFYVHERGQRDRLIGSADAAGVLPGPGSVTPVTITLDTAAFEGPLMVGVVVDPDNHVSEISKSNNTASRRLTILPNQPGHFPPPAPHLTLNGGLPNTTIPQVSAVLAFDVPTPQEPAAMYLVERVYNPAAQEWVTAQQIGWMPFAGTTGIVLTEQAGVHFIEAWVADGNGDISPGSAIAEVNYLPATQTVRAAQAYVYRLALLPGQTVTATLDTLSGDADLYVWGPGGRLQIFSDQPGTAQDQVEFTPDAAGMYQVEVRGYEDAEFRLDLEVDAASRSRVTTRAASVIPQQPNKTTPVEPSIATGNVPSQSMALPAADVNLTNYLAFLGLLNNNYQPAVPPSFTLSLPFLER